jgi:heat shock protein HtpX
LATALLAPMAAGLLQMAISRSREFEADRTGAELVGSGLPLASALQRLEVLAGRVPMDVAPSQASHFIVNPLTGRTTGFANLFRTHPTTEERVARLQAWQPSVG